MPFDLDPLPANRKIVSAANKKAGSQKGLKQPCLGMPLLLLLLTACCNNNMVTGKKVLSAVISPLTGLLQLHAIERLTRQECISLCAAIFRQPSSHPNLLPDSTHCRTFFRDRHATPNSSSGDPRRYRSNLPPNFAGLTRPTEERRRVVMAMPDHYRLLLVVSPCSVLARLPLCLQLCCH